MTTAIIKDNNLIITCGSNTEIIPIYKFKQYCNSTKFKLSSKFKILNYLFTLQKSYIAPLSVPVPPDTVFSTSYISTMTPSIDCDYLVLNEKVIYPFPMSRSCEPRKEIIQLYRSDYVYRVKYKSNRMIRFINLIPSNNAGYPLIDMYGNTLEPVIGEGYFDTVYWSLFVVQLLPGEDRNGLLVELEVTATEKVDPIAAGIGDICISVPTKSCGVVSVKVATKYTDQSSIDLVPIPELVGLAELLHANNRIQKYDPCFGTTIVVEPTGPFFIIPVLNYNYSLRGISDKLDIQTLNGIPFEITIPFKTDVITIGSIFGRDYPHYFIMTMPKAIPENLAAKVGDYIPELDACKALYLQRTVKDDNGQFIYRVSYKISYHVEIVYHQKTPDPRSVEFWLASQWGISFNNYNWLCDNSGADTRDYNSSQYTDTNGDTVVIFNNSYRINNSCGNYFEIGFYPGYFENITGLKVSIKEGSWIKAEIDQINQVCTYGTCQPGTLK